MKLIRCPLCGRGRDERSTRSAFAMRARAAGRSSIGRMRRAMDPKTRLSGIIEKIERDAFAAGMRDVLSQFEMLALEDISGASKAEVVERLERKIEEAQNRIARLGAHDGGW